MFFVTLSLKLSAISLVSIPVYRCTRIADSVRRRDVGRGRGAAVHPGRAGAGELAASARPGGRPT